jgi:hypothetical protein
MLTPARARAIATALPPTASVTPTGLACLMAGLAAVPAAVSAVRDKPVPALALVLFAVVSGAALAWAAEDPAAELLSSMPIGTPIRTATRVVLVTGGIEIVVATAIWLADARVGVHVGQVDHVPEAAAAAAVALAAGVLAARRGDRAAAQTGLVCGLLLTLAIGVLAQRWPHVFPGFTSGATHARWWVVTSAGAAVALLGSRDPGARGVRLLAADAARVVRERSAR